MKLFIIRNFGNFVTAVFVAVSFALASYSLRRFYIWWHFRHLKGNYLGYGYKKDTSILSETSQSKATILEKRRNTFKIEIEHGENCEWKWKGKVTMHTDLSDIGAMSWKYVRFPEVIDEKTVMFGFKKCIFDSKTRWLYVEGQRGFGIEIFKPEKSS